MVLRWKDKKLTELDRTKLLRNSGTYTLLLVALFAMTFFGVCDPQTGLQGPQGSAAKVNGEVISALEFRRAYRQMSENEQQQNPNGFDPVKMQFSRTVMQQLVDERIMFQIAVSMGMEATLEEVSDFFSRQAAFKNEDGSFSPERFQRILKENRYTEATMLDEWRRRMTVNKFQQYLASTVFVSDKAVEIEYRANETKLNLEYLQLDPAQITVTVTDADVTAFLTEEGKKKVQEFYDAQRSEFNTDEKLKARHILVGFTGARNASAEAAARSKENAKARAEEILTKVKAAGADFAKIAGEMTDEAAGKTKGGDLGFFARDAMVKEFADAAFALKVGEISGVVESPFGFHVIKAEAIQPGKNQKVEDVTNQIARRIIERDRKPALLAERATKVLEAAKSGDKGKLDGVLKEFGLAWKETGEISAGARFIPTLGSDDATIAAVRALRTPQQLHDGVLDVRDSKFIVRLKTRSEPDMAKLTAEKKKELADSARFTQGYKLLSTVRSSARKDLEKGKRLWENPDFALQDERRAAADSSGADEAAPGS